MRQGLCFLLGLCGLLVTACSGDGERKSRADLAAEQGILFWGNGAEPQSLDPHVISGVPEFNIADALFEGLVYTDPETLEARPAAAESWEVLDEGTRYVFHLRHNLRWSNGDKLTAHDFYYSFQRVLSPGIACPYLQFFKGIKNAVAYGMGELDDFSQVGFRVVDDYTLEILLEHPHPVLLSFLSNQYFYPVHQATIEKFGAMDERGTPWIRAENMVSNGAFSIKSWDTNVSVVVVPNPYYWDRETVKLKEVHFIPIESIDAEHRAFSGGQLHITTNIPQHLLGTYMETHPPEFRNHLYLGTYYYGFNTAKPPFDDVRVRKALSMAIDRKQIVGNVVEGGQEAAYSFIPPGAGGYQPDFQLTEDLEEARRLLAEAGYPNGEGFPHTEILYNTSENHKKIAEAIQQMWKEQLGIQVQPVNMEWKVYLDTRDQGDYQIARAAWVGGVDMSGYLDIFETGSGNNDSNWSSPEFDALIEEGNRVMDSQKRIQIFQRAEKLLLDDMVVAPMYFYTYHYLVDPRIEGWTDSSIDRRPLKFVYFKE